MDRIRAQSSGNLMSLGKFIAQTAVDKVILRIILWAWLAQHCYPGQNKTFSVVNVITLCRSTS